MTLADDLGEWMEGDLAADTEPESMDPAYVDRILRRIRRLEDEQANVNALAQAERDRIEAWRSERTGIVGRQIEHYEQVVEGWMRANFARNKVKTTKLPNGELKLRPGKVTAQVENGDRFARWAVACGMPQWARVTYAPDKAALTKELRPGELHGHADDGRELRQAIASTGEIIPGVLLSVPICESFSYRTAPKEGNGDDSRSE